MPNEMNDPTGERRKAARVWAEYPEVAKRYVEEGMKLMQELLDHVDHLESMGLSFAYHKPMPGLGTIHCSLCGGLRDVQDSLSRWSEDGTTFFCSESCKGRWDAGERPNSKKK